MAKVIVPVAVIDPRKETFIKDFFDLALMAAAMWATSLNNGDWTVTYMIRDWDLDMATVGSILAVGGEVEERPIHAQGIVNKNWTERKIWDMTRYEYAWKLGDIEDLSLYISDAQLEELKNQQQEDDAE